MAAECVAGGCPIGDAGTCPATLVTSGACRHLREPLTSESESSSSEPSSRLRPRLADSDEPGETPPALPLCPCRRPHEQPSEETESPLPTRPSFSRLRWSTPMSF